MIFGFLKKFIGKIMLVMQMKLNVKDYTRGETIKIIREWTTLTQKEFAQRIGKSKRTIEQYEAGTVNYGIDVLKKISKEFNIDIIFEKK